MDVSTEFVVNHDAKELGDAIRKLITDPALHEKISVAALKALIGIIWSSTLWIYIWNDYITNIKI